AQWAWRENDRQKSGPPDRRTSPQHNELPAPALRPGRSTRTEGDEESSSRFHFARSLWFVYLKRFRRDLWVHRANVDGEYAVHAALAVHFQRLEQEVPLVQLHYKVIQPAAKSVRPGHELHCVTPAVLLHRDGEVLFQVRDGVLPAEIGLGTANAASDFHDLGLVAGRNVEVVLVEASAQRSRFEVIQRESLGALGAKLAAEHHGFHQQAGGAGFGDGAAATRVFLLRLLNALPNACQQIVGLGRQHCRENHEHKEPPWSKPRHHVTLPGSEMRATRGRCAPCLV